MSVTRPLCAAAGSFLAMLALCASALSAQQPTDLQRKYLLPLPVASQAQTAENAARAAPGSSAGSPSAFGPNWGDVFAGAGFQSRTRYAKGWKARDAVDGAVITGFGLGDASRYVGLEVDVTSFGTFYSGFYKRTGFGFKLHRMLPNLTAVAVGWENAIVLGDTDGEESFYGVASKIFPLRSSTRAPFNTITISAGVGNGRFRFEDDIAAGRKTANLFGSVGLRVNEPLSVIADWAGQDLALGVSIVPFRRLPIVITPALVDVTGKAGDGVRFTLGAGLGANLSALTHRP